MESRPRPRPTLHVCGLNHEHAPLEVRERFAVGKERCAELVRALVALPGCEEGMILSTCNRTEIYAFSQFEESFSEALEEFFLGMATAPAEEPGGTGAGAPAGERARSPRTPLYSFEGREAIRHFFSVCAGLDSMMLGENEIKAQVQQAYELAREAGSVCSDTHALIERAHRCCKRIKTETSLNTGTLSIGRAAILQAERVLGTIEGKVCIVIGAGKVGRVAAMAIHERRPARLILVNRSVERAREVAEGLEGAEIVSIPEMAPAIREADLIIGAAFAPNFLVTRAMFEAVRGEDALARPVCLVDTAVPRILDQAIGEVPGVTRMDIGHMNEIVAENHARRMAAAQQAWVVVEEEVEKFRARQENRSIGPLVERLKGRFESVFDETVAEYGPDVPEELRKRLQEGAHRMKQKMLHAAITELKTLHLERGR